MQKQDSPNTEKRVCLTQPKEILQLNKKSVQPWETAAVGERCREQNVFRSPVRGLNFVAHWHLNLDLLEFVLSGFIGHFTALKTAMHRETGTHETNGFSFWIFNFVLQMFHVFFLQ